MKYKYAALSSKMTELDKNKKQAAENGTMTIPEIGVNSEIVWAKDKNKELLQKELLNGIVHYPGTATPENYGNGIYIGHSSNFPWQKSKYNNVFALLGKLKHEDEIIISWKNKKHRYSVFEKKILAKNDEDYIFAEHSEKSTITLVTCWPPGTNLENLAVKAKKLF